MIKSIKSETYNKYNMRVFIIVVLALFMFQNTIIVSPSNQVQSFYVGEHKVFFGRQMIPYKVEDVPGLNIVIDTPLSRDQWCHVCVKVVPSSDLTIKDIRRIEEIHKEMETILDKAYNEIGVDGRIYTVYKLSSGEYLSTIGLYDLSNNTIKKLIKYIDENANLNNVAFSFYKIFTPRSKYNEYNNTGTKLYKVLDKVFNYHYKLINVELNDTEQELYKLILKLTNNDFKGYGVYVNNPDYILTIFIQTSNTPDRRIVVEFIRFIREHYVKPDLPIRLVIGDSKGTPAILHSEENTNNIDPLYYVLILTGTLATIVSYYILKRIK